jgi:cyclophilin family peptidyl-prolyl cis-trans isomerase
MKKLLVSTILLVCFGFILQSCTKKVGEKTMVEMQTSAGTIVLELDAAKAPKSVENFLQYVNDGFYDGTIFHRVIDGFMIQGGGFDDKMQQKSVRSPIKNEASNGLNNIAMTIAMARTNDPDSATAQFFINLNNNQRLDKSPGNEGYAVFGKVVSGDDVVRKIGKVKTATKGFYGDVPVETVTIQKVTVKK